MKLVFRALADLASLPLVDLIQSYNYRHYGLMRGEHEEGQSFTHANAKTYLIRILV